MTLRLVVVSHTYCASINHAKLMALAHHASLTLIAPHGWRDALFTVQPDSDTPRPYTQHFLRVGLNGRLMLHAYLPGTLARILKAAQPDLVFVEEEPLSLAFAEFVTLKARFGYRLVGFTWENLRRAYGLPGLARYTLPHTDGFIAGNADAAQVLRWRGFRGPIQVTPQLGIDPEVFRPANNVALRQSLGLSRFTIGFIGRIVTEKGIATLLRVVRDLPDIQLLLIGDGPQRAEFQAWAEENELAPRVVWLEPVKHEAIPAYLNALDVLVLPSQTTARWKEQFGHVLIEAMACGVPVVGSQSGAIPEVIADAGLTFPTGDAAALRQAVLSIRDDPSLRGRLIQAGRARVLAHFTHDRIACAHVDFFWQVLGA